MKFGRNVLQVNTLRLTESDFQLAAMTSFHATKCCHLVSKDEGSAGTMQQRRPYFPTEAWLPE